MNGALTVSESGRDLPAVAVTIIIPAYNCAAYVDETLQSVFAQTVADYEVIVINDGSPDTEELERALHPHRERIRYIKQENRGVSGARNTGIRAARGALICLLDNDDLLEPEYLAELVAAMESDPDIDVIYPNALIIGDSLDAGCEFMDLCPSEGEVTFENLVTRRCTVMARILARRGVIVGAGMFDESLSGPEDFDLWLRIVKSGGRIAYHRRVLARLRRRRGSISSDPISMCSQVLRVLENARRMNLTPAELEALERGQALTRAALRFWEGKRALFRRDVNAAVDALTEANEFLRSRKVQLFLILLRLAPRAVLRWYVMRDRMFAKREREMLIRTREKW